jgi:hypothetical protein
MIANARLLGFFFVVVAAEAVEAPAVAVVVSGIAGAVLSVVVDDIVEGSEERSSRR